MLSTLSGGVFNILRVPRAQTRVSSKDVSHKQQRKLAIIHASIPNAETILNCFKLASLSRDALESREGEASPRWPY